MGRGVGKTTFVLFSGVRHMELAEALEDVKKSDFEEANVLVDVDNKVIILDTDNGRVDINFSDYDQLLNAIIKIGKALFIYDMADTLTRARDYLRFYRAYPELGMAENEVNELVSSIDRAIEKMVKGNFTLTLKLGDLEKARFDVFVNDHPEIKRAIDDGIERYKEVCIKNHEDDDPSYCERVNPEVGATVYAVPEDKRIVIVVYVEEIGEVYRYVQGYENAYDFLKALEDYRAITVNR